MATLSPMSNHLQRPPPPTLFQGPPSRNASNLSLSTPAPPLPPPASSTNPQPRPAALRTHSTLLPDPAPTSNLRSRPQISTSKTESDRTDAQWTEMQNRLADVEVSAFNSTHVFGPAHSAALDELRKAQIELANSWRKGAGDDDGDNGGVRDEEKREEEGDDEEADLAAARRRREANDKYFERVRGGVEDVVGKLEGIAQAMAKVERESMNIWDGSDILDPGSRSTRERE